MQDSTLNVIILDIIILRIIIPTRRSSDLILPIALTSTISAMQMGGFDIDVGNGEKSSWQWHEEQKIGRAHV